jgi:hypothetical protein
MNFCIRPYAFFHEERGHIPNNIAPSSMLTQKNIRPYAVICIRPYVNKDDFSDIRFFA